MKAQDNCDWNYNHDGKTVRDNFQHPFFQVYNIYIYIYIYI